MTVDRVDETPFVEHNTLTQKMKQKSKKIVMDAEQGKERKYKDELFDFDFLAKFHFSLFDIFRRSQTCN